MAQPEADPVAEPGELQDGEAACRRLTRRCRRWRPQELLRVLAERGEGARAADPPDPALGILIKPHEARQPVRPDSPEQVVYLRWLACIGRHACLGDDYRIVSELEH